jgi:hypothetical protein
VSTLDAQILNHGRCHGEANDVKVFGLGEEDQDFVAKEW